MNGLSLRKKMMNTAKYLWGFSLLLATACGPSNNNQTDGQTTTVPAEAPKIETKCYILTEGDKNQDSTLIMLAFSGNLVSGTMDWQPFEKDGAHGTIEANLEGDRIKGVYHYMIEGSRQSEQVEFKMIENDYLAQKQAELVEKIPGQADMVFKDPNAPDNFNKVYRPMICPQ